MSWLCRNGYWGHGGLPLKLQRANASLKAWLQAVGMSVSVKRLTVDNLVLKGQQFPEAYFVSIANFISIIRM